MLVGIADQRQGVLARGVEQVANLGYGARAVLRDIGANALDDLIQGVAVVQQPRRDLHQASLGDERVDQLG